MNQHPSHNFPVPPNNQQHGDPNAFMQQSGMPMQPPMGYMNEMRPPVQQAGHPELSNPILGGMINEMAPPPQQMMPPPQPMQQAQPVPQQSEDQSVIKCSRFINSIVFKMRNQRGEDGFQVLQNLIQNVLYFDMTPDDFTVRLEEVMGSRTQPHLRPFLVQTIPALRRAIRRREIKIDCVAIPPGFIFDVPSPQQQQQQQQHLAPPPQQLQPPQHMMTERATNSPIHNQNPAIFQRLNTNFPPNQQRPPMAPMQQAPPPPQFQHQQHPQHPPPQRQPPAHEEEESTNATMRHYTEHNLRFCLIDHNQIMNMIARKMRQYCAVEEDALMLISDATERHFRQLLHTMKGIAEHRIESSRLIHGDYEAVDNTKSQLKFLENLEKIEKEQRDKERLERTSLTKQNKYDGMRDQQQKIGMDEVRRQQANEAASVALAGNRAKKRWESNGGGPMIHQRPKTIRVNCRDLHIMVNNDHQFSRSILKQKLAYRSPTTL